MSTRRSARVHAKGGTVRTVLLDDRGHLALLKLYLGPGRLAGSAVSYRRFCKIRRSRA